jgi:hypothetical protein
MRRASALFLSTSPRSRTLKQPDRSWDDHEKE